MRPAGLVLLVGVALLVGFSLGTCSPRRIWLPGNEHPATAEAQLAHASLAEGATAAEPPPQGGTSASAGTAKKSARAHIELGPNSAKYQPFIVSRCTNSTPRHWAPCMVWPDI